MPLQIIHLSPEILFFPEPLKSEHFTKTVLHFEHTAMMDFFEFIAYFVKWCSDFPWLTQIKT